MSIRVENIGKSFGSFVALDRVTLDFPDGELVALLGPSGCGKTTLLRIIAGLESADHGRILLDGVDATEKQARERHVGFVFQHYALFRHMSVFENVAFGLRVKPRGQRPPEVVIRRKVHDLLELVQLDWLADRSPAQLSGGQRQRIALARALAVEPKVLLLDEPFGALDAKVRKELRRWLRQLHDDLHITSIFVTHDQEEALELADRIVVMNKGHIEQIGAPANVYERPDTPFVYGFLGASNILRGRVENGAFLPENAPARFVIDGADMPAAQAYFRPHDVTILSEARHDTLPAKVQRILELGALARIELAAERGPGHFEAELPRAALPSLSLKVGETVHLAFRALRVFPEKPEGPGA